MDFDGWTVLRRSLDARRKPAQVEMKVGLGLRTGVVVRAIGGSVSSARKSSWWALDPAGLYCALRLIEQGLRPVVLERGKAVRDRRRDLVKLIREGRVDPESNYCFGEGGAGTYSDGKLYTRAKKRGAWFTALGWLVEHGADPDILVDTHPHIGTNKLPGIIEAMRERIRACGGEVRSPGRRIGAECRRARDRIEDVPRRAGGHSRRAGDRTWRPRCVRMDAPGRACRRAQTICPRRSDRASQSWVNQRQYRLSAGQTAAEAFPRPRIRW